MRHVVCRIAGVALLVAFLAPSAAHAVPNLTIDGGQVFQLIDGVGTNINVNSWDDGNLEPALDMLVGPPGTWGGATTLRVIRDPMTWVTDESDVDALHNLDPATLSRIYEAPAMQDLWGTIGYLNSRGMGGDHIILNFMGWTPEWLGGSGEEGEPSHVTTGKEGELATVVASLVYYGRVVKGLDFTLLGAFNEMDNGPACIEGPCMDATQYCTVMHELVLELNHMGLADIDLVGPDTAFEVNSDDYISCVMSDTTVAPRMRHLTIHKYSGPASPRTPYTGVDYWLTEIAGNCSNCDDGGTPTQGEWPFSTQSVDFILGSLKNGMGLVCYYDGYDSFYYHHDYFGYWGLLAYDQATGVYTPRKRFFATAQINGFIRPGSLRIGESHTLSGLGTTVAAYDTVAKTVSIVGRNTSGSSITINGQLTSLPTIGAVETYLTDGGSLNLSRQPDVPVTGGAFTVTIPANTVFSLVGHVSDESENTPPIATASALPASGVAPLAVNFSGAQSIDADGDSLWYHWWFGDGATAVGRLASHTYTSGGSFTVVLTVNDGQWSDTTSVIVAVTVPASAFPENPVLDNFSRANGPIGSNWIDQTSGFSINSNALAPGTGTAYIEWNTKFGRDQEAYVTFSTVSASASEQNLMLKTQGSTWSAGHLEISYMASTSRIGVYTYSNATWTTRGTINGVSFASGDRFGARTSGSSVDIYKNNTRVGTVSFAGWAFADSGGHIGLSAAGASFARFDNFGGGTVRGGLLSAGAPRRDGRIALSAAYPNPTSGGASFALTLAEAADVRMVILDVQGRQVASTTRRYAPGHSSLEWDGTSGAGPAAMGVYLARIEVGATTFTRTIAVVR